MTSSAGHHAPVSSAGADRASWPTSADDLVHEQHRLARLRPRSWQPGDAALVGACFVCFPRGGSGRGGRGDPAWAAAVAMRGRDELARAVERGAAGAPYEAGLLALREGGLLEAVARALDPAPDVLLVDATARDHPRAAGLARHLGAVLDVPTIGVTHRPLLADGDWPAADERGAASPLSLAGAPVGFWMRTRRHARPLAIHPGWRIDPDTARTIVLASLGRSRTPEPLRRARHLARLARAGRV
jgi:deoxyribonuclease V